jgi:glycosyltransferase involved in cell wall biosynthesis
MGHGMLNRGRVIAAIPAYNEAKSICRVVREARRYVDEVIVIDDGSSDHTAAIAAGSGASVIQHTHNAGKAAAIMTAFRAAAMRNADVLVLLDGDGQHDPSEISQVIAPIQDGRADVVIGSRFLDVKSPVPRYRTLGQRVLNIATHHGSGVHCSDSQCGFRALNRRAFTAIQLSETIMYGLVAESEMQFEICAKKLRLVEVPVYVSYNDKARRNPFTHGAAVLYRIMALTIQRRTELARRGPAEASTTNASTLALLDAE